MTAAAPCCLTRCVTLPVRGRILTLQTLVAIPVCKKEPYLVNRLPDERPPRSGVASDLGTIMLDHLCYQSWFRMVGLVIDDHPYPGSRKARSITPRRTVGRPVPVSPAGAIIMSGTSASTALARRARFQIADCRTFCTLSTNAVTRSSSSSRLRVNEASKALKVGPGPAHRRFQ